MLRPVGATRLGQRRFRVEPAPGAHDRIAFGDPLKAAADDGLYCQLSVFEAASQTGRGKTVRFDVGHDPLRSNAPAFSHTAALSA